MDSIKAILIDIGGVLYVGDKPIDGAIEAIDSLKKRYKIKLLTNTTQRTSKDILNKLKTMGFNIDKDEILTALDVTKMFLLNNRANATLLLTDSAKEFFSDIPSNYPKKYVVVGDAQDNFTYKHLNSAFRDLLDGMELIAIAKNRYFKDRDNKLSMDAGCFVKALEYASGKMAKIIGKPSKDFFHLACKSLNVKPNQAVMIGDDIESDIKGAKDANLRAFLVKSGKYNPSDLEKGIKPDKVLESIASMKETNFSFF